MKKSLLNILKSALVIVLVGASSTLVADHGQDADTSNAPLRVALVNFKDIVEKSKLGKQEQTLFEAMRKQMENILAEKEKGLKEIADKLDDENFLDSLKPEAEEEFKNKARLLSQEYAQAQNQYLQALQQANLKILQKLADTVARASETIAKEKGFDLVLNNDGAFYQNPNLDISSLIVEEMDKIYDQEIQDLIKNSQRKPESSDSENPEQ